jgi:hypothetical protein
VTAFATPVLDDFNRANGALGANWGKYDNTCGVATVVSNVARSSNSGAYPYTGNAWLPATYLNSEVYATLNSWPLAGANGSLYHLWARAQNQGTVNAKCYVLEITVGDVISQMRIGQANNTGIRQSTWTSDWVALTSPWMSNFAMGDKVGFRCYDYTGPGLPGVMLEGWSYMAAEAVWTRRICYNDHTSIISSAGNIGFSEAIGIGGQTCSLEDFGGGTIATPTPYTTSDMSYLEGALPDPVGEPFEADSRPGSVQFNVGAMQDPVSEVVRAHLGLGSNPRNHPGLIGARVQIR